MIIAFDVDLTLIDMHDRIRWHNVDLLRWFINNGDRVIVWSGGGLDWAEKWVRHLGLEEHVEIASKTMENSVKLGVDIAVDDEFVELGRVNIKVSTPTRCIKPKK